MQAVAHGTAKKKPKGLSKAEAKEFVEGQSPKGLPEKVSKRKKFEKKISKKLKKVFK